MRFFSRPGGLVLAALMFPAIPVLAQSDPPVMQIVVSPEVCTDRHTLGLTHYVKSINPRRSLFELQKGCLGTAPPTLVGPEMLTGLTLQADYGEGGNTWVDTASSDQAHARSTLNLNPYWGLSEEDAARPDVVKYNFRKSDGSLTRHAGFDTARGEGFAFRTVVTDGSIEGKPWLATSVLSGWTYDAPGQGQVYIGNLGAVAPLLFDIAGGRVTAVQTVPEMNLGGRDSTVEIAMSVTQGNVSGALRANIVNHTEPASRVADEWETALVDIPLIAGYVVGTPEKPLLIAWGVGTTTYIGPRGSYVYAAAFSLTAEPLAPGMTRDAFRAMAASWGAGGG